MPSWKTKQAVKATGIRANAGVLDVVNSLLKKVLKVEKGVWNPQRLLREVGRGISRGIALQVSGSLR
jgi:hypothetical protein